MVPASVRILRPLRMVLVRDDPLLRGPSYKRIIRMFMAPKFPISRLSLTLLTASLFLWAD